MDLLGMIYNKDISLQDAEILFDEIIENVHKGISPSDWGKTVGFSEYETTAYAHGACLSDLVILRYQGWPGYCCICNAPLDYRLYGWLFVHSADSIPLIKHIICPTANYSRNE